MTERRPIRLLFYAVLGLAGMFIIFWGIQSMAFIINPILLAMVITISLLPLINALRRRGLPDWLALVITVAIVILVLAVVMGLIVLSFAQLGGQLTQSENVTTETVPAPLTDGATTESSLTDAIDVLYQAWDQRTREQAFFNLAGAFAGAVLQAAGSVGVAILILFFMLASAVSLPQQMRRGLSVNEPIVERISQLTLDVQRYVSIMTVINFLVGMGNTILLWIVGVPYAILWGVLAWVMGYIPTVGFWIALIPPVLLAWASLGVAEAVIVFLAYVIINGSVQNFVQPRMMGERLQISPLIVLISLFFWGGLLGAIGAILSVPLTLLVLTILDGFDGTRWIVSLARFQDQDPTKKAEREAGLQRVRRWAGNVRHFVIGQGDDQPTNE